MVGSYKDLTRTCRIQARLIARSWQDLYKIMERSSQDHGKIFTRSWQDLYKIMAGSHKDLQELKGHTTDHT